MHRIRFAKTLWLAPLAVGLAGCFGVVDPQVNCASLGKNFSYIDAGRDFAALPTEKQYIVYICANQKVHPPMGHLATLFANEGPDVVPFLVRKMEETTTEVTVIDILEVFEAMQNNSSYGVARDKKLLAAIEARIARMSDPLLKPVAKEILAEIRK